MPINVIAIIPTTTRDAVKALIDAGETPQELSGVSMQAGRFKDFTRGPVTFTAVDFILDDESEIDSKMAAYPDAEIIGAWEFETGLQLGTSLEEGEIVGTPTYPLHIDISKLFKTRKILDEFGAEIGSIQEGFHKMLGQADRSM